MYHDYRKSYARLPFATVISFSVQRSDKMIDIDGSRYRLPEECEVRSINNKRLSREEAKNSRYEIYDII